MLSEVAKLYVEYKLRNRSRIMTFREFKEFIDIYNVLSNSGILPPYDIKPKSEWRKLLGYDFSEYGIELKRDKNKIFIVYKNQET
ncbi:MAG: hypothetical protein JZD41_02585 [Thermoproteus sp.]|nr:hypothetical protein [Thermoproteus sp.]